MAIDKDKIFGFLKKNGIGIGALAVSLVAIAVPFLYADGLAKQLKADLDSRASEGASLDTLLKATRTLPALNPEAKDPEPLKAFPSDAIIKSATAAVEQFRKNVNDLLDAVIKFNKQPPLVAAALPGPLLAAEGAPAPKNNTSNQAALFEFRDAYRDSFLNVLVHEKLNAGFAPSPQEIADELAAVKAKILAERTVRANGQITNQPEVDALLTKEDLTRPMIVRQRIAEKSSIYVSPVTFRVESIIEKQDAPSYPEAWYAQVGYWLQNEIVDAIAEMNKGSKSVYTSPVKHLVKIDFSPQFVLNPLAKGVTGEDPSAAITVDKRLSYTGHGSNGFYDVLHFKMQARVTADKVPDFLRQLSNNRLITVLSVDLSSVDSVAAAREGYVYGPSPVVEVRLQAEALFFRRWTKPLMPQVIREGFHVVAPSPRPGQ